MNLMMKFKDNLRLYLARSNATASQLSRATGISKTTISSWAAGAPPRNLDQVKKVADYFNISVDDLVFTSFTAKPQTPTIIEQHKEEINAGVFEVILRPVKDNGRLK